MYSRQNPSPAYLLECQLSQEFSEQNKTFTGKHVYQSFAILRQIIEETGARTLLDYGCGKGRQFTDRNIQLYNSKDDEMLTTYPSWIEALGADEYVGYDPGWAVYATLPTRQFDGVISTDALEHVPPDDMAWVIEELFSFARKFIFCSIACFPAKKVFSDGSNTHRSVKDPNWWVAFFAESGQRHPHVRWDLRLEPEADPKTHIRIAGQGTTWGNAPIWWKTEKPYERGK